MPKTARNAASGACAENGDARDSELDSTDTDDSTDEDRTRSVLLATRVIDYRSALIDIVRR